MLDLDLGSVWNLALGAAYSVASTNDGLMVRTRSGRSAFSSLRTWLKERPALLNGFYIIFPLAVLATIFPTAVLGSVAWDDAYGHFERFMVRYEGEKTFTSEMLRDAQVIQHLVLRAIYWCSVGMSVW